VSRPGDLWLLGRHRLLCGDAPTRDVARLLDGVRPHLMVTDPPYGVSYDPAGATGRGLGDEAHRQGAERRPGRLARGLGAVPGDVAYVWHGALHATRWRRASPRASTSARRSSGPRSGWCSAAATTTGSTSPAGTRCGRGHQGPLERATASSRRSGRSEPRPGRRHGPRHPEAGRVHAPADPEQLEPGPGGLRALLRIGQHADRGRDHGRPASRSNSTRPMSTWRCCAGRPSPVHDAGVLTIADRAALAAYCQAWARWVEAEEKLKETPMLLKTPSGYVQQSPWLSIANKQLELMGRYMAELGLTPVARTRLARTAEAQASGHQPIGDRSCASARREGGRGCTSLVSREGRTGRRTRRSSEPQPDSRYEVWPQLDVQTCATNVRQVCTGRLPRKLVAYERVSTARQGASGLGLEAQRGDRRLRGRGGTILARFTEVESGGSADRPELAKALQLARRSRAQRW
jgi:P27 family predicted phage terminase small subunit